MSSQNDDNPMQSGPTSPGGDSRLEWPSIPDDRPVTEPTGTTDADAVVATDAKGDDDAAVGTDEEVKECFLTFRDLFEQGNSIVAALPAKCREAQYDDETRVAIFEGINDGQIEYFKIVRASSVKL